jgi:predicted enzyme related to lactoylglutathione lyase
MNPVTWFEIPVSDMYRAKAFYEFVLDLALEIHEVGFLLMALFPMDDKGAGAAGALVQAASWKKAGPSCNPKRLSANSGSSGIFWIPREIESDFIPGLNMG